MATHFACKTQENRLLYSHMINQVINYQLSNQFSHCQVSSQKVSPSHQRTSEGRSHLVPAKHVKQHTTHSKPTHHYNQPDTPARNKQLKPNTRPIRHLPVINTTPPADNVRRLPNLQNQQHKHEAVRHSSNTLRSNESNTSDFQGRLRRA